MGPLNPRLSHKGPAGSSTSPHGRGDGWGLSHAVSAVTCCNLSVFAQSHLVKLVYVASSLIICKQSFFFSFFLFFPYILRCSKGVCQDCFELEKAMHFRGFVWSLRCWKSLASVHFNCWSVCLSAAGLPHMAQVLCPGTCPASGLEMLLQ